MHSVAAVVVAAAGIIVTDFVVADIAVLVVSVIGTKNRISYRKAFRCLEHLRERLTGTALKDRIYWATPRVRAVFASLQIFKELPFANASSESAEFHMRMLRVAKKG